MRKNRLIPAFAMVLLAIIACTCGGDDGGGGGGGPVDGGGGGGVTDISGSYDVYGTNQDGSAYSGTADIASAGGDSYTITWRIGDGQSIQGTGTLVGGVFTVDDGEFINTYTVLSDGTLDGTWTQRNVDGTGTEVLTPR